MTDDQSKFMRPIRSFVLREGRLTEGQQRALDELYPRYGLSPGEAPFDFSAAFGREAPVVLEIGFGNGDSLATMAEVHPERDYVGIEVHRPGVGHLLLAIEQRQISNLRVICDDAQQLLGRRVPDGSLSGLQLFFPDPWHKKRHNKRRLVQPEWAQLVRRKLKIGGFLHMATDWEDYAHHMMAVLESAEGFENTAGAGQFTPRPEDRPLTRFEARGHRRGHGVWDLIYRRVG